MTAVFRFDGWELWPAPRQLLRDGRPTALGGRAFDLLQALLEQADRLVPKDELLERVWPGLAVEPNNLQVQVWALRRLLGPSAIVTVARRGYRLTLPVQRLPAGVAAVPLASAVLVTLTGDEPAPLRRMAEALAAQRRAGRAAALWRFELPPPGSALPSPAWPDAADPLWRRLAGAPGQLLLLDAQHAPLLARRLAHAARLAAPMLQLLATARQPLGLAGEVVVDLRDPGDLVALADPGQPGAAAAADALPPSTPAATAGPALRWQARRGPSRR